MDAHSIEYKFNTLPGDSRKEVLEFIDSLMTRRAREATSNRFDFTWEGGLSDLKDKYDSVGLQHQQYRQDLRGNKGNQFP